MYSYDSEHTRLIKNIEFSMLGNDEINNMSAFGKDSNGVIQSELFNSMEPTKDGLVSNIFGTTDEMTDCQTCGLNSKFCVGHFGHINLAEPVFHIGYLTAYVKKIFSCICSKCSGILIDKNEDDIIEILKHKSSKARLAEVRAAVKNVSICPTCGTIVPNVKVDINKKTSAIHILLETTMSTASSDDGGNNVTTKNKSSYLLNADACYDILSNISDKGCIILGLNPILCRPEQMIHKIFPVPPIQVRPSTKADFLSSSIMANDLTVQLTNIVKANNRVVEHRETVTENNVGYGKDIINLLQFHVATYFNNESNSLPKNEKGRDLRSITYRLKGKEGRIRSNLMGKRVDFSGRTVITSDPTLELNQMGVPIRIARTVTFPEIVTPHNIEHLSKLVKKGPKEYPGANFVFPKRSIISGNEVQPIDLRFGKDSVELKYGDIVERHLTDGDYVLLNRQPTLHKQSMMALRIKVINNLNLNTFRIPVSITTPFNADFDGDEMNIFLSQCIQTQIELEEIADVKKQIITPASSVPIIGLVQDGLLGAYNLTSPTTKINKKNAMNIMSYTSASELSEFKKKDFFTGSELFSMIIPERINMLNENKSGIIIKNGKLIDGQLTKKNLKSGERNNIIQTIWDEYGAEETKTFLDNIQKLANHFNLYNGFTIGIDDATPTHEVQQQINKIYSAKDIKVAQMITEIENNPDLALGDSFEIALQSELSVTRDDIYKLIISDIPVTNKIDIMRKSGSKGNPDNMVQIIGCVGLIMTEGKLAKKKVQGRTFPYFHENDDTSSARGFVKHSYTQGLNYTEYLFGAIWGREGAIDTSIKTASSGYAQRKLIKNMEDAMIQYDGTVRTATNVILQFTYGEMGADTITQYEHSIKMMHMGNDEIKTKYGFSNSQLKKIKNYSEKDNNDHIEKMLKMRNLLRNSQTKNKMNYAKMNSSFMIPVNLQRIINNAINSTKKSDELDPKYIVSEIERALSCGIMKLVCMSEENKTNKHSAKYKDDKIIKTTLRTAMYEILSPKKCIIDYEFDKKSFDDVIANIISGFNKNIVEAGTMVGLIAAQSMGECLTQMTLNTFHTAGVSAIAATTTGMKRVDELTRLSKTIKTPQMILYLTKEHMENKKMSNRIASYINHVTIGNMKNSMQIIYDPNPLKENGYRKKDNIMDNFYSQSKNGCQVNFENLPWLFRIVMDKDKMLEKETTLLDIKSNFCNSWEKWNNDPKLLKKEEKIIIEKVSQCSISSNSDNDDELVIHIRIDMINVNINNLNAFYDIIIDKFKLKGIANVNEGIVNKEDILVFDNEDETEEKKTQYAIYTNGVNLNDIRYIAGIDLSKTVCNDVSHIYNLYGIEAARSALIKELMAAYSGHSINVQHFSLLADVMTSNGFLVSIDRHGMTKSSNGPLSKASFENTMDHFITAAVFNESDNMKGISARIMAGMAFEGGTGLCKISLDTDMLEKSEFTDDISQKYIKTYNNINTSTEIQDIINKNDDDMFMPM